MPISARTRLLVAAIAGPLALALTPAAGGQSGDLPETLRVPAGGSAAGTAVYKAGVAYKLDISGQMTRASTTSPDQRKVVDAFYCFGGSPSVVCSKPEEEPSVYVRTSGDPGAGRRQLPRALDPRDISPPYRDDHSYSATFVPHSDGRLEFSTKEFCTLFSSTACSGDGFTVTISEKCGGGTTARTAAINEVRVVAVQPEVEVHKAGSPEDAWCKVERDSVLKQGDEISVDPDGAVTLQFADNSTVVVKNTTQLKIASFFTEGGVVRTEILLKMGEVAAKVNKSEATKSDFRIKSPTAVSSVRGTTFSVFYDPLAKSMLTSVADGRVEVDPVRAGLKTVTLKAGQEIDVGARSASGVTKVGKAGARGGLNRVRALAVVMKPIRAANGPCGITTPRDRAFAVTPATNGWKVTVQVQGKLKGSSKWTVLRGKGKPANALAKKLQKRCR